MSEVPFKDFLIFLFHSASSSQSSTRVNSPGSNNNNTLVENNLVKNTLGDTPTTDNNENALVNKTKPLKKITKSQKTTMIYGRQVQKKIISSSSSSSSPLPTVSSPEDLGQLNILIEHKVPSSTSEESKSNHHHARPLKQVSSDQNKHENNIGQNHTSNLNNPNEDSNIVSKNEDVIVENARIEHESLLTGQKRDPNHEDNIRLVASSLNNNVTRGESSQSTSGNSCYRELLGEYHHDDHVRKHININSNDNNVIDDDNNIDFQYDDHDHLHVHENHDLSFYKNFSATTRSKSSLACGNILSKSITDDNHHYHHLHHQHIFYSSLDKRLSRSTPIQLDMITSFATSVSNPTHHTIDVEANNDQLLLQSNLYHHDENDDDDDDDDYQYDQYEKFPNSRVNSSHDKDHLHNDNKNTQGRKCSVARSTSSNSLNENDDDDDNCTDMRVRQHHMMSLLTTNSKSTPTLSIVDVDCPAISPRRINTTTSTMTISKGTSSKNKRVSKEKNSSKGNKSNSGKTTVTVTMDSTSLFLDTVFVNVKQDLDSSSTIRLFY